MTTDITITKIVLATKRIIKSETLHNFEKFAIDDSEHIPRMARIAHAVQESLSEFGTPMEQSEAVANSLLDYARKLYVDEWMRPHQGEEYHPIEEEAVQSFNKYLMKRKKRTSE